MTKFDKFQKDKKQIKIGVVGYSDKKFDKEKAKELIATAFDKIEKDGENFSVVSGLTNLGIPALAYKEAVSRGWKTVGIACGKASEYELFLVDEKKIIGDNWGDESETFLKSIDILVRIGGGKQSIEETKKAKEMGLEVIEYELPIDN